MPELDFCLFDLFQLFRLVPKADKEFEEKLDEFEDKTQEDMFEIRLKLFSDLGYEEEYSH